MAAAQLRAPLYEDKVVDFLFSKAEVAERKATRAEIEADLEFEEGHVHGPGCGHDHAAKPKARARRPRPEAPAKRPVEAKEAPEPKPAKKPAPAKKAPCQESASKESASKARNNRHSREREDPANLWTRQGQKRDSASAGVTRWGNMSTTDQPRIAVLLPCYNEEAAIAATVAGFRAALPGAAIYVYDNNSRDSTAPWPRQAGAIVRSERQQGKGHVVRRMFADVDADVYIMADGDLTYDPKAAPAMVDLLLAEQFDMVVGTRRHEASAAYRGGHVLGNRLFTGLLSGLFGRSFSDIFSGYRVFSRRFVKSFPVLSAGFEIETEMSVHALELRMPVGEVETAYGARPEGSHSKLSTYRRRLADPEDHRHPLPHRAAGVVLRRRSARCC